MLSKQFLPLAFLSATALIAQNLELRTVSGKPEMLDRSTIGK